MVQLKTKYTNIIPVGELKDGQLAEVISWDEYEDCIGTIVQRFENHLISVGEPWHKAWSNFYLGHINAKFLTNKFTVRILSPGELLEVTSRNI